MTQRPVQDARDRPQEDFYDNILVPDADDRYTTRERLAIEFAERFGLDHASIDDDFISRLREEFDDGEVVDLALWAARCLGIGRLTEILRLS